MTSRITRLTVALAALALATPALAHTGLGATHSAFDGFAHPLGGADHFAAMLAVGLIGGAVGARGILLPIGFMLGMLAGALVGFAGLPVPAAEWAIAGSVVALGLLAAFGRGLGVPALAIAAGGFALFHGWAHAAEAPLAGDGLAYVAGFLAATAAIHAAGFALVRMASPALAGRLVQIGGLGTAALGLVLVAGL